MEERIMPPPPPPISPHSPIYTDQSQFYEFHLPNFNDGTYIVQIPRDQIYRVPPPENAKIAQQHRFKTEKIKKRKRCWRCSRVIFNILIVLFICGLLGGFYIMLNKPRDPNFSIQRFIFHNDTNPTYNITLLIYNPNIISDISYREGKVSLFTRQQEIASGKYPNFFQHHRRSMVVTLALNGIKGELLDVVHESLTNDKKKVHVTFSLYMQFAARTYMVKLHGGTKKYEITCQMMVDTLAKATRLLSQDCQTKRL